MPRHIQGDENFIVLLYPYATPVGAEATIAAWVPESLSELLASVDGQRHWRASLKAKKINENIDLAINGQTRQCLIHQKKKLVGTRMAENAARALGEFIKQTFPDHNLSLRLQKQRAEDIGRLLDPRALCAQLGKHAPRLHY